MPFIFICPASIRDTNCHEILSLVCLNSSIIPNKKHWPHCPARTYIPKPGLQLKQLSPTKGEAWTLLWIFPAPKHCWYIGFHHWSSLSARCLDTAAGYFGPAECLSILISSTTFRFNVWGAFRFSKQEGQAFCSGTAAHRNQLSLQDVLSVWQSHIVSEPVLSALSSLSFNLSTYSLCIYLWAWNLGFWNTKGAQDLQISVTGFSTSYYIPEAQNI